MQDTTNVEQDKLWSTSKELEAENWVGGTGSPCLRNYYGICWSHFWSAFKVEPST